MNDKKTITILEYHSPKSFKLVLFEEMITFQGVNIIFSGLINVIKIASNFILPLTVPVFFSFSSLTAAAQPCPWRKREGRIISRNSQILRWRQSGIVKKTM
jgi:hypothetical protein